MQSSGHGHIARSSSSALSLGRGQLADFPGAIPDDFNIAHGLLSKRSRLSQRMTSRTETSTNNHDSSGFPDGSEESRALENSQGVRRSRRGNQTSNTWTSSSGDVLTDQDEIEDRTDFIQEYNRLAKKHGIRPMVPDENEIFNYDTNNSAAKPGSWFSRKILRRTSSTQSVRLKPERGMKHKRSISDLSMRLMSKKDRLKDKDLQELVRLCGASLLYLPTEYAAGSLSVPTCFRATAQYLVQYGITTRGIFRIPGSHYVVANLYNHYCTMDDDGEVIAGTVRCPTLPDHIRCDVHDVASAFKKFLSGLPGGILGSLPLFDALISIKSQLRGDPETTRTKESKIRARLIALAIATVRSQYQRELICAVFGLLCMIGRAAETARREDERGRPLPTHDLMGYGPLGIVFGPLLLGDLLEDYTMRLANPHGGLILLPISPPKSKKEKQKKTRSTEEVSGNASFNTHVDKIKIANSIAEMLITHWRDVVRHLRNLSPLKVVCGHKSLAIRNGSQPVLRPSISEPFALRKPRDWDETVRPFDARDRSSSPTPMCRNSALFENPVEEPVASGQYESLTIRKQRSRPKPMSSQRLSRGRSFDVLSPTVEEQHLEEVSRHTPGSKKNLQTSRSSDKENMPPPNCSPPPPPTPGHSRPATFRNFPSPRPIRRNPTPSSHRTFGSPPPCSSPKPTTPLRSFSPNSIRREIVLEDSKLMLPPGRGRTERSENNHSSFDGVAPEETSGHPFADLDKLNFPRGSRRLDRNTSTSTNSLRKLVENLSPQELSDVYELLDGTPLKTPEKAQDSASRMEGLKKKYPNTAALIVKIDDTQNPEMPFVASVSQDIISRGQPLENRVKMIPFGGLHVPRNNRHIRRQIHSDYGPRAITQAKEGVRQFSRSYDDPKQKRFLNANQSLLPPSRDPLSRVSVEEDLASLATLAQALDIPEDTPNKSHPPSPPIAQIPTADSNGANPAGQMNRRAVMASRESGNSTASVLPHRASPHRLRKERGSGEWTTTPHKKDKTSPRAINITGPVTPKRRIEPISEPSPRASPNTKVSALVARFSNAQTPDKNVTPTRLSPLKTPNKETMEDARDSPVSRRGSLIAPYTKNSPSPTKSQKSANSERLPVSLRNSPTVDRQQKLDRISATYKRSSPSRLLRKSFNATPPLQANNTAETTKPAAPWKELTLKATNPFMINLRPVRVPVEERSSPTKPQPVVKSSFPVSLRPVPGSRVNYEISTSKANHESLKPTLPPPLLRSQSKPESTETLRVESEHPHMQTKNIEQEIRSSRGLQGLNQKVEAHAFSKHAAGLDGCTPDPEKAAAVLPPLIPTTVKLKTDAGQETKKPVSASVMPRHQDSVQHQQITGLQRQLAAKIDEVRQLRQQLEAREVLDIDTLSDELRDTKREIERWKRRAELAERQLEILTQYSTERGSSIFTAGSSMSITYPGHRFSREDYSLDSGKLDDRLRRILQGGDGAGSSSQTWDSEESSETVARRRGVTSVDEKDREVGREENLAELK